LSKKKIEEENVPCPNYVFIKKGVDGNWQLEIPLEYQEEFKPVKKATYERWLKEKLENPTKEDLEDMKEYEMEP
jgi:hypothetical protein